MENVIEFLQKKRKVENVITHHFRPQYKYCPVCQIDFDVVSSRCMLIMPAKLSI